METDLSSSLGEHLRQHHRATTADRAVLARAVRLDERGRVPVRHRVAVGGETPGLIHRTWA